MRIEDIANNDNKIVGFSFDNNCLVCKLKLWDGRIKQIKCNNYYGMKEKQCINIEIGDIEKMKHLNFYLKSRLI